ncbi:MAG: tetratricopeptide repeat protein [Saprospiraceae bacterium]
MLSIGCKSDVTTSVTATGDPEIDKINTEISQDPDNPNLYFKRAQSYYEKESYDLTILDIQKAMTIDSLNPDFYHLLTDAYLDYYNSSAALNTMRKVLTLYPERIPSLLKMAELKYILQDYDGSILTVNEVVRLKPQNAEAYYMLGLNFRSLNDPQRAINAFQTAVEMDSKLTDAWISLGELYEEKKDKTSLKYYENAIISDPTSMQALHAKAFYLQNHGSIAEAQDIYKNIIIQDRTYSDAYLNSGLLYLSTDSIDRAYEQFDLLTSIAPTNDMGFYLRGVVNEKKGNLTAAKNDYQSAYNLNKNDPKVKAALDAIQNQ